MPTAICKAQVMRKAWKIYRQFVAMNQGTAGRALFRAALRRAWADAKQDIAMACVIRTLPKAADLPPPTIQLGPPIIWMKTGRSFAW